MTNNQLEVLITAILWSSGNYNHLSDTRKAAAAFIEAFVHE